MTCELVTNWDISLKMGQVSDGQSWASHATKGSLRRLDKNVMEILLEKDERGLFDVSDNEVARLLQKLGVSLENHVEMVQICHLGRNTIQVTLKKNVSISLKKVNYLL